MACRYCLEEEGEFVSPCRCRGSVGLIHEKCLNTWIEIIDPSKDVHCPICLTEIKTNFVFGNYLFRKRDPLNKESFYLWVLAQLAIGILLYRYDEKLLHTLYIYMQIGIYIAYNSFIWYWLYNLENKKIFMKYYLMPGNLIISFMHTHILIYMYMYSRLVDPLVINWLFCIVHLLYPINIRELNTSLDKTNMEIAREPRRWVG